MAKNSKTISDSQRSDSKVIKFLKENRYKILISVIAIYYLQYYIFYAISIITYPFHIAFNVIYSILYNLIYFICYIVSFIAITLRNTILYIITCLCYSIYFIISLLFKLIVNVVILTISLLLLVVLLLFIAFSSENNNSEKCKESNKVQESYFKEMVILPNRQKQLWMNPSNRCTCTKLSTTKLIEIQQNGERRNEFDLIENLLETTRQYHPLEKISGYRIRRIERINNCCLWTRYLNRTMDISKEATPNVRILFHATTSAKNVVEKGFDERFSHKEGLFGAGVYFAEHSSKSNQYAVGNSFAKPCSPHNCRSCTLCIRTMFLCRVTLGNPYKLTRAEKMSHPPPGYHSVEGEPTANGLRYPEFVIYRGEQAYPEYKITYTIVN